jgi:hypothetical protein
MREKDKVTSIQCTTWTQARAHYSIILGDGKETVRELLPPLSETSLRSPFPA